MYPSSTIRKFRFDEDIEIVRLNHFGSGLLYNDRNFRRHDFGDGICWRRPKDIVNRPLFIDGRPSRFDALQGKLGNCWLVSSMEAITRNDDLIKHVVPPNQSFDHNYIGAFHFRIWKLGAWYDVVVDDFLPVVESNLRLYYTHSMKGNVFWAALLEKAYAKFCSAIILPNDSYSYYSLDYGNSPMLGMQSFSGGIIENAHTLKIPSHLTVKRFMANVYDNNALMICACRLDKYYVLPFMGLVVQHSYTVTKIVKFEDNDPDYHGLFLVRLLNPWGKTEWNGQWRDDDFDRWKQIDRGIRDKLGLVDRDDGEFWMHENDFTKFFGKIRVCHLGPGRYLESHNRSHSGTWSTLTFSGEWVKDNNAGGKDISNRHINPQYAIQLEKFRDNAQTWLNNAIIELSHWSKPYFDKKTTIGFFIYSLENYTSIPLDSDFFTNNEPLNKFPNYPASEGRAYSMSTSLFPGKYCIVPCTEKVGVESQFLLRVFSENRIVELRMNNKIGRSLPTEQENLNKCDEGLRSLFNDIAQGQDEIDWIGLKVILEAKMNPERYYLGIFTSFFQLIREVVETFLPFRSSNNYEIRAAVFSKDQCRSMIAMFDDNHSGKLSFSELSKLWNKISFWNKVFEQHRDEKEGCVTVAGLRDALCSMGYSITKRTVNSFSYVYANEQGEIFLTDFILCGVTLETVLSLCEKELVEDQNKFTFTLEEWVKKTLIL